ncbi:MAG: hypothetical protein ACI8TP_004556, partial [Acidimicrobiales bacterium]
MAKSIQDKPTMAEKAQAQMSQITGNVQSS